MCLGKQYGVPQKDKNGNYHIIQQLHLWEYILKNLTQVLKELSAPFFFIVALFTIAKI
jgi:hypothetical protein